MSYVNTWIEFRERINWNQWRAPPLKVDKDKKRIYDVELSFVIIGEKKTGNKNVTFELLIFRKNECVTENYGNLGLSVKNKL
jgi:hypothetical protein